MMAAVNTMMAVFIIIVMIMMATTITNYDVTMNIMMAVFIIKVIIMMAIVIIRAIFKIMIILNHDNAALHHHNI